MSRIAYVNGRYLPARDACVNVEDRGYQFADGVYEAKVYRRVLELVGLKQWMPPREEGYASLHEALDRDEATK